MELDSYLRAIDLFLHLTIRCTLGCPPENRRNRAKMTEKTEAEIPYSMLEYTATFAKPVLEALSVPAQFVAVMLNALEPFGFQTDGVELKTRSEKLSKHALVFRRNPAGVTFTLGVEKLVIVAENLDWSNAEQFMKGARSGLDAVLQKANVEIKLQNLVLGIHIQLKTKPRQEVTAPLLSAAALKLLDGELKMPGIILQREKCSIVIDGSLAFANGLFVRINRAHEANRSFEQMAEVLRGDEMQLFDLLNLEGEL